MPHAEMPIDRRSEPTFPLFGSNGCHHQLLKMPVVLRICFHPHLQPLSLLPILGEGRGLLSWVHGGAGKRDANRNVKRSALGLRRRGQPRNTSPRGVDCWELVGAHWNAGTLVYRCIGRSEHGWGAVR